MRKHLFLLFLAALFATTGLSASNKAFVSIKESPLYYKSNDKSPKGKLPEMVAKGDTVYTTPEARTYLEENRNKAKSAILVEYKDKRAYIDMDNIYPIRLEPSDTLTYFSDSKVEAGSFREQKIIPAMEWAMNVTTNYMQWIYLTLIAFGCAIAFRVLASQKKFSLLGYTLVGVSLAVMSAAEWMYWLSFEPYALWFLKPSIVNGWGHVILNFLIMAIVCAGQTYLFYNLWESSFGVADHLALSLRKKVDDDDDFDEDDEDETGVLKIIINMAWLPIIIGVVTIVLIMVGASSTIYMIMGGLLAASAIAGAIYQFVHGRVIQGLIFPIFYLAGSLGIILLTVALSFILILVAVVGVLLFIAIAFVLSFIGGIFGPSRVDFVDEYGRKHSGTKQLDGTVKGDDGNLYKIKD